MTRSKFAALAGGLETRKGEQERAGGTPPGEVRKLGARLPLEIAREFDRQKLDAEEFARLRRVTTEAGLEVLVRLMRDPELRSAWHRELVKVVDES